MRKSILPLIISLWVTCHNLYGQDYFITKPGAYKEYTNATEAGKYKDVKSWLEAKCRGQWNTFGNKEYCPSNDEYWVRYFHLKTGLSLWFKIEERELEQAQRTFDDFLQHPRIAPNKDEIIVGPVYIKKGNCIQSNTIAQVSYGLFKVQNEQNEGIKKLQGRLEGMDAKIAKWRNILNNPDAGDDKCRTVAQEAQQGIQELETAKSALGALTEGIEKVRKEAGLPPRAGNMLSDGHTGIGEQKGEETQEEEGQKNGDPKKGDPKAKDSKGKGGKKGIGGLPIPSSIAKWLQMLTEVFLKVVKYLLNMPWLEDVIKQVLMMLYLIAPEIVEAIDGFLGRVADIVVPNSIERAMDSAADIYEHARKYIGYLETAANIMNSKSFNDLVNGKFDIGNMNQQQVGRVVNGTINGLSRVGAIPPEVAKNLNVINGALQGADIKNILNNPEEAARKLRNFGAKKAKEHANRQIKKYTGIDIDINALKDCVTQGSGCKESAKKTGKQMLGRHLPDRLKPYANDILNGDYKNVSKNIVLDEFQRATGVNPQKLNNALNAMRNGNYKSAVCSLSEHLHKCAGGLHKSLCDGSMSEQQARAAFACFLREKNMGNAANIIEKYGIQAYDQNVLNNIHTEIRNGLNKIKDLSPNEVEHMINNGVAAGISQFHQRILSQELSITDKRAVQQILAGNLDTGIEIELQSRTSSRVDYREKANTYVNYLERRTGQVKKLTEYPLPARQEMLNMTISKELKMTPWPRY